MSAGRTRPSAHGELFARYVAEIREALDEIRVSGALPRISWGGVGAFARISGLKAAEDQGRLSTHPRVVAIVRKYFFACLQLNKARPPDEFILPNVFAVEMLTAADNELLAIFTDLPYLPVGLDENEQYV